MRTLKLSNNPLIERIPPKFGKIKALEYLTCPNGYAYALLGDCTSLAIGGCVIGCESATLFNSEGTTSSNSTLQEPWMHAIS